jgi:hypothetical protein
MAFELSAQGKSDREIAIILNSAPQALERLASFLKDIPAAWEQATQEQRDKPAGCLFEAVWIKDKQIVAVKPQPELEPFF